MISAIIRVSGKSQAVGASLGKGGRAPLASDLPVSSETLSATIDNQAPDLSSIPSYRHRNDLTGCLADNLPSCMRVSEGSNLRTLRQKKDPDAVYPRPRAMASNSMSRRNRLGAPGVVQQLRTAFSESYVHRWVDSGDAEPVGLESL